MQSVRLAASGLVALILLLLSVVLAPAAFDLATFRPRAGIGPGALPQFIVISVTVLTVVIFIQDLIMWWRTGSIVGADESERHGTVFPAHMLLISFGTLLLLVGFAAAWRFLSFLPAAIGFMIAMALLLVHGKLRSLRGMLTIAATSVLFCSAVWALFVFVLKVPLR